MPGTKRSSKVVSYNEQQDDDDFIPIVNKTKKSNSIEKVGSKPPEKIEKIQLSKEEIISDHESSTSQSSIASHESKMSDIEEQDENLAPKTKRLKHDVIVEESTDENEEESTDNPILNISRISTARISDPPRRHSTVPLGFPTSKIHIPSAHVSRVGLSRKSLPAKSLHPNLTSRIHPE